MNNRTVALSLALGCMLLAAQASATPRTYTLSAGAKIYYTVPTSYGTMAPGIVLAGGGGLTPSTGYDGFTMMQTGMFYDCTFSGPSSNPSSFNCNQPQPYTPDGIGLYEYHVTCGGPWGCSTSLQLVAVLFFTAVP